MFWDAEWFSLFKNQIIKNFPVNAYAVPTEMYKRVKWSFQSQFI